MQIINAIEDNIDDKSVVEFEEIITTMYNNRFDSEALSIISDYVFDNIIYYCDIHFYTILALEDGYKKVIEDGNKY